MKQENDHLFQALVLANEDFNIEFPSPEIATTENLKEGLTRLVHNLIENDFERLLNGLYQIDVGEEKVKQAMAAGIDAAVQIAELIIERELQKAANREKYKKYIN